LRPFSRLFPLLLSGFAWPALAAEGPGVSFSTYFQAFLGLVLIIGLLLFAATLARKFLAGKGFGQGGMRVIGGVALGARERIVLLEVGEEWLVIGIVPGQIRTLHKLPKGEMPADSLLGAAPKSFAQFLQPRMDGARRED
jgi:flagellar protein FliO/FliZ